MIVEVARLDAQIEWLRREGLRLRERDESWATRNADIIDEIRETLRQVRQDYQMRGMLGERIDER